MKSALLYIGLALIVPVVFASAYCTKQIFSSTPATISEPVKVQEQTPQVEFPKVEKPTEPAKITSQSVAKSQSAQPADNSFDEDAFDKSQAEFKKTEAALKKSSKEIMNLSNNTYQPPTPVDNSAALAIAAAKAAAAAKKLADCEKTAKQCMSAIGSKIMNFQGSAYQAAAKALGDDCNNQYQKCIR